MIDITKIPLDELLKHLEESGADIAACETALSIGIAKAHNEQKLKDRINVNKAIIAKVQAEIARRKSKGYRGKYIVKEIEGFDDVRVFHVSDNKNDLNVQVWLSHGTTNCTYCYGPLSAMLANCPHCKAVKRHLNKLAAQIKKCQTPALPYLQFFEDAQRRLSAGEIQVFCTTCQRYQWRDRLCILAKARNGQATKP